MSKKNIYLTILLILSKITFGQIVGGELFLKKINEPGLNFELGMTNYFNGKVIPRGMNYSSYYLRIYRKSDNFMMDRLEVLKGNDIELSIPNKKCTDSLSIDYYGIPYRKKYFLDPNRYNDPGGYFIKYDECCRQLDVKNINNSSLTSIVYYGEFPNLKLNPDFTSPEFRISDYQIYCVNTSFVSNLSAVPVAGLTFKYYLDNPLTGYTTYNSPTLPVNNSLVFNAINWKPGYSFSNIFHGSPTLSIDENTGVISGHSVETGNFVFSIKCEVLRGTTKLGYFKRDFTLTFIDCSTVTPQKPTIMSNNIIAPTQLYKCSNSITLESDDLPEFDYLWKKNGAIFSQTPNISVSDEGVYSVYKTPKNSCNKPISSDSVTILKDTLTKPLELKLETEALCVGIPNSITTSKSYPNISWYKDGIFVSDSAKIIVNSDGLYKAVLKGYELCNNIYSKDSISISFNSPPLLDVPISNYQFCSGTPLKINNYFNSTYTYQWLLNGIVINGEINNELRVNSLGNYRVIVSNGNCIDTSGVYMVTSGPLCGGSLSDSTLYFPNVFSPNNDLINESYKIYNLENIGQYNLSIYNKWGEVIFESSNDDSKTWDGFYNSKPVPIGEYIFKIKLPTYSLTGMILVIR